MGHPTQSKMKENTSINLNIIPLEIYKDKYRDVGVRERERRCGGEAQAPPRHPPSSRNCAEIVHGLIVDTNDTYLIGLKI